MKKRKLKVTKSMIKEIKKLAEELGIKLDKNVKEGDEIGYFIG